MGDETTEGLDKGVLATHGLNTGGARVAYRTFGTGRRPLILIHGWMTSGAVFDDFVSALDDRPALEPSTRIVALDLVGTGASSRPTTGYSLTRFAADVLALIESLAQSKDSLSPVILGHSMGGQIAQLVAAAAPESIDRLVLINPVPLSGIELPDEARELFRSCAGDADKLGMILGMASHELSAEALKRLIAVAVGIEEACIVEAFDAWTAGAFEHRLSEIVAPTLVLATDDPFLPTALLQTQVVDRIENAELRYLSGPGHYPIVERPVETAEIVASFLSA